MLGMTVSVVNDTLRQEFGLSQDTDGLVVVSVEEDTEAFRKGMREGDVIAEIGQKAVASPDGLTDAIAEAEEAGRNSVLLLVRRDGAPRFVALNLSS